MCLFVLNTFLRIRYTFIITNNIETLTVARTFSTFFYLLMKYLGLFFAPEYFLLLEIVFSAFHLASPTLMYREKAIAETMTFLQQINSIYQRVFITLNNNIIIADNKYFYHRNFRNWQDW